MGGAWGQRVDLDDPDLLEEVGHRLHGVVVSQALHEDGVVVGVILVLHCRGRQRGGRGSAGAIHKWLVFGEGESVPKKKKPHSLKPGPP